MNRRTRNFLIVIGAILLGLWLGRLLRPGGSQLRGLLTVDPAKVPSADYQQGDFTIRWDATLRQITVEHKDRPGFALWQTLPGEAFLMAAQGEETVTEKRSMYTFHDKYITTCVNQTVDTIRPSPNGDKTSFIGTLDCAGKAISYEVSFFPYGTNQLSLLISTSGEMSVNRLFLNYASDSDEHFFGFGEQFSYFDMKGKKVPIWVSEQGVGRGDQPITLGADLTNGGAGGDAFTTYAPVPFYMTSKMHAMYIDSSAYMSFDMRRPDRVQLEIFNNRLDAELISGTTPAEIISTYTSLTGRMQPLPDWILSGAIVGMQGGTDKIKQVYQELKSRNVPIAAFWLQDWVGQRTTSFGKQLWWNWEVDTDRYPGWDAMVVDFNKNNIKTMVYASPYLADVGSLKPNIRRNLFQEAKEKGYLVKNASGEPYLVLNTDFYFGMIDLTNPDAYDWYKQVLKDQVIGAGASGWMADFGEGLPYDAVLYSGAPASVVHNEYTVLWAKLNREVVAETGGDLVFFNRSAYSLSPQFSTLFWEGDQLVSWGRNDGIKSAVTGLNTSGLSGFAFNHSDIGGYTTVSNPLMKYNRSEELLLRWMEMNAFTTIFRTHEGNQPDKNIQFYSNGATLDAFARWSKVYAALFDYRKALVAEAAVTGLPVVRHPFIQYPDYPEVWKITYQEFMLGPDFLIAPVTDKGDTRVKFYLPRGNWVHVWTGKTYTGGQYLTIDAPIGQPAVFYLEGSHWGSEFVNTLQAEGLVP